MVPTLCPGDLVSIRHCNPQDLETNSIIVFRQNERLIVHRLVRQVGSQVMARGDASPYYDDPVDASAVLGQVESIVRNGRAVSAKLRVWKRFVAAILRRSESCTQLYLRMGSRIGRWKASQVAAG